MKILVLMGIFLMLSIVSIIPACHTPVSPASSTTTTTAPSLEPVAVVSVIGPLPPINPGGPIIEITLKNVSTENIVSLKATLGIGGAGPGLPPTYFFNVSSTAPLEPGKTVSAKLNIIGGGFDSEKYYPLSINGTVQSGITFGYTEQVKITAPAQ